jgi:hypothetical protein
VLFCGLNIGLTIFEHLSLLLSLFFSFSHSLILSFSLSLFLSFSLSLFLSFSLSLFLSFAVLDDTMATIGKRCRYLRELNLQSCAQLTDVACESIGQYCKQLRQLSLEGCGLITDEGAWQCWGCWLFLLFVISLWYSFVKLTAVCSHLLFIFFNFHCPLLTGINDIARSVGGSLTSLNLNKCQFVTDESLTCVGEACQSLKELKLSWMQSITDRGIYTFSSYANVQEMKSLGR